MSHGSAVRANQAEDRFALNIAQSNPAEEIKLIKLPREQTGLFALPSDCPISLHPHRV